MGIHNFTKELKIVSKYEFLASLILMISSNLWCGSNSGSMNSSSVLKMEKMYLIYKKSNLVSNRDLLDRWARIIPNNLLRYFQYSIPKSKKRAENKKLVIRIFQDLTKYCIYRFGDRRFRILAKFSVWLYSVFQSQTLKLRNFHFWSSCLPNLNQWSVEKGWKIVKRQIIKGAGATFFFFPNRTNHHNFGTFLIRPLKWSERKLLEFFVSLSVESAFVPPEWVLISPQHSYDSGRYPNFVAKNHFFFHRFKFTCHFFTFFFFTGILFLSPDIMSRNQVHEVFFCFSTNLSRYISRIYCVFVG